MLYSSPQLTDEQNKETYGKCNNFHGHGHNYVGEYTTKMLELGRHISEM